MVEVGKKVDDFTLPTDMREAVSLSEFLGKKVVLYFYPKDNTSGCTLEAQLFRDHKADFDALNTVVLGISKDGVKSHCNFKEKHDLNFEIFSDKEKVVHDFFDVMKPKKMYGKEYIGVERSTFIMDEGGILIKEFRKVKVKDHIEEVLTYLREL